MSTPELDNSNYPKAYNEWAGNKVGVAPDYTRCCVSVRSEGRWPSYHQCARKRGFGPGEAYCKAHVPETVAKRADEASKRQWAKWNAQRYEWNGKLFYDALEQIAKGHNDARGLAQQVIDTFKAGERK